MLCIIRLFLPAPLRTTDRVGIADDRIHLDGLIDAVLEKTLSADHRLALAEELIAHRRDLGVATIVAAILNERFGLGCELGENFTQMLAEHARFRAKALELLRELSCGPEGFGEPTPELGGAVQAILIGTVTHEGLGTKLAQLYQERGNEESRPWLELIPSPYLSAVQMWEVEEEENWEEVWNRLEDLASQDHAFEALMYFTARSALHPDDVGEVVAKAASRHINSKRHSLQRYLRYPVSWSQQAVAHQALIEMGLFPEEQPPLPVLK